MSGSIRAGFGFETQPRRVTSSRVARLFLCPMPKRFTDTEKWKKPFIRGLQGPYKLLVLV